MLETHNIDIACIRAAQNGDTSGKYENYTIYFGGAARQPATIITYSVKQLYRIVAIAVKIR